MATLRLVQGVEPGKRFPLTAERSTIGRSSDCEVSLDVAAVSRRHAEVIRRGADFVVEDLGSRNGTYVNGQRIAGPTVLASGDLIGICDQEFAFEGDDAPGRTGLTGMLVGNLSDAKSSLVQMVDDRKTESSEPATDFQATIGVGGGAGGATGWSMSARPEVKLAALIEIAKGLGRAISIDEVLPKLLDSLFKVFTQADRGFVVMRPAPDAPLVPVAAKTRRGDMEEGARISRTIVEEAMTGKKAILSADAASDERFGMAESIAQFQIRSMMCVPLIDSEDEPMGVIQIDTLNQRSRFEQDDLEVLAAVASLASVAVDNARMHDQVIAQRALQRDLELATRMQRALLPAAPPTALGYAFFDFYESARQVGGDYYDYVNLPGGRFAVVLGDVAGKGVAAAIVMAKLSSDVRFALATEPDLASAVKYVNRAFCAQGLEDRFVTMIYTVVDPATNEVTLVNAGHMAPYLRRVSGEVLDVHEEITGLPIGVMDDYDYELAKITLEPGESLTLFTDGFNEAMNATRDLYGLERIAAQVRLPAKTIADLGNNVITDVRKFVNGFDQSDDMCLCVFGRDAD
ncbi:SpoIIE family protein phosphatase [Botrimarina mediterranea]|uniref:Phosphoserine phosphatase RsbP n=1 Tax=Botrimarina mediterranea TaxID=2528022 RepID=A0A518K6V1_9BACT|nr:SpoIIE family protein phosphatase [Botrimarina mediterranea]QDV73510.1 Phosphoserine phosphatase RsbP [Botrimarina mediterranea]QDV78028.1 Phosphoserine phosphatase RsbP [Planctomycetes bacterium K2D]